MISHMWKITNLFKLKNSKKFIRECFPKLKAVLLLGPVGVSFEMIPFAMSKAMGAGGVLT